jgi:hypothetical protein
VLQNPCWQSPQIVNSEADFVTYEVVGGITLVVRGLESVPDISFDDVGMVDSDADAGVVLDADMLSENVMVGVAVTVSVREDVSVPIDGLTEMVTVGDGDFVVVRVIDCVRDNVGVTVGGGVTVDVLDGVGVGVRVRESVAVRVTVAVFDGVGVGVRVRESVAVRVSSRVIVGSSDLEYVGVGDRVGIIDAVRVAVIVRLMSDSVGVGV